MIRCLPPEVPAIERRAVPSRAPDLVCELPTRPDAALLYRLSGDLNPLHIDPAAAAFGGFDRPILHGLCTYGHCGQMLLGALCDGDAGRFGALRMRFASPVYPGDTLALRVWRQGPGQVQFEGRVGETVVVSSASFSHH